MVNEGILPYSKDFTRNSSKSLLRGRNFNYADNFSKLDDEHSYENSDFRVLLSICFRIDLAIMLTTVHFFLGIPSGIPPVILLVMRLKISTAEFKRIVIE